VGETWKDKTEGVDPAGLLGRKENWGRVAPEGVIVITAGVDVQQSQQAARKTVLHWYGYRQADDLFAAENPSARCGLLSFSIGLSGGVFQAAHCRADSNQVCKWPSIPHLGDAKRQTQRGAGCVDCG